MTGVVEQIDPHKLPLDEVHRQSSATMIVSDGWSVPANYGDVLLEYAAVREGGAGLFDLSSRGRLRVTGSEAINFLNGLITNDMKTLGEDRWMAAVFPNVQGRVVASVRVARCREGFLIDTEAATHERVRKMLERFTLAGDFQVSDITNETAVVSLQGKVSAEILRSVLGEAPVADKNEVADIHWRESHILTIHATHTAEDGYDLVVGNDRAGELWRSVIIKGARSCGRDALNILRIEAGIPFYGVDMNENTVVSETNLDDAVSYTKGCYLGQEIIARIKYRGHVAKRLAGVVLEQPAEFDPGTTITSAEGTNIGAISSATFSPHLGTTVALGYVKYDYLAADTHVKITTSGREFGGRVRELPFVRGSWYDDEFSSKA